MTTKHQTRLNEFLKRCQKNHHRGMVILAGDRNWSKARATELSNGLLADRVVHINSPQDARPLLGTETDAIIFNAYEGLNLDALAISAGTIRGGGILILRCPALDDWPEFNDPEYQRLLAHPYTKVDVKGRFLTWLVNCIRKDANALLIEQTEESTKAFAPIFPTQHAAATTQADLSDQSRAVEAIVKHANGRARRPLLITADRGRGKSAALGLAALKLMSSPDVRIIITAPSPAAVRTVFKHASDGNGTTDNTSTLQYGSSSLTFCSPDELILAEPKADLLLVDEAAAIPIPLLNTLLTRYARIIFTSTVHGYEGTGRAFLLRFNQLLDQTTPQWRSLQLEKPVRFSANDPLEHFIHKSLLLDAEPTEPIGNDAAVVNLVSRDQLINDEAQLRNVFGILTLAHYQTRPDDLRHMLDAPNIDVFTLGSKQNIFATAMIATEGQLDPELIENINSGKRRPRGHLLPQTLIFQCQQAAAGSLKCARVVRIAVHPDWQDNGFGSQLLQAIEAHYRSENFDLLGTSFGLSSRLLRFWRNHHFNCVRIGRRRNASSGYHSGLLIKPLNDSGEVVSETATVRFHRLLPAQLASTLSQLDPEIVTTLFEQHARPAPPDVQALSETKSCVDAHRNRHDVLNSLQQVLTYSLCKHPEFAEHGEKALLISSVLQLQPDSSLCHQFQINGEKALSTTLKDGFQKALNVLE